MVGDLRYLLKRGDTWYVIVEVPKALQHLAGRTRFKKSLKTDSLAKANVLKHAHVAEFMRQIDQLSKGHPDRLAELKAKALEFRDALAKARAEGLVLAQPSASALQARPHLEPLQVNPAEELMDIIRETAREVSEEHGTTTAEHFFAAATGQATFIRDLSTQWLTERTGAVLESVRQQQRAVVERYLQWAGEYATIEETDRRKAGEFVGHLLSGQAGVANSTARRWVSSLSKFWRWLIGRGLAATNPWTDQEIKSGRTNRAALTDDAIVRLLQCPPDARSKYGQEIHDLMRLALVSGARIEELCALRRQQDLVTREDGWWLLIQPYGEHRLKTASAAREVPLHFKANHVVERLSNGTKPLAFPNLTPGGADSRRSWNVSRSFSAFRQRAGVGGAGQVFHALRNTFTEAMEGAEVPESTVKLLVGHTRGSITFGHYSKGTRVDLRAAIDRLPYSAEIFELIAKNGPLPGAERTPG